MEVPEQGKIGSGKTDNLSLAHAPDRETVVGGAVGTLAPNYMAQMRYWLEDHKTYQKRVRGNRMRGIVHLYYRVERNGKVLQLDVR